MTAPDGQIAQFVDRIIRLKDEERALKEDIRDVYAEAKSTGLDKTVLGKVVNYVEKRAADSDKLTEAETIFDLYLDAYDSAKGRVGTRPATHTHETLSERAKARMSESMADHKVMSADLAKHGLISEEAHAETAAIADGMARKFGNGALPVHDEDGVIADPSRKIEVKPRTAYLPNCRNPDNCAAGSIHKHCHTCSRAMEGAAA